MKLGNNAAATGYSWVLLGAVGSITARAALTFRNNVIQIYKYATFVTAPLCFSPSTCAASGDIYLLCKTFRVKPFYYQLMHIMLKNTELLKHSKITLQHVSVYIETIFRELKSVLG